MECIKLVNVTGKVLIIKSVPDMYGDIRPEEILVESGSFIFIPYRIGKWYIFITGLLRPIGYIRMHRVKKYIKITGATRYAATKVKNPRKPPYFVVWRKPTTNG